MSQSEQKYSRESNDDQFDADNDRRRYKRWHGSDRRELIRFNLSHTKRRSGTDRRLLPTQHRN